MATGPAVSVVIPTYRRPDLVLAAVRSALEQTLQDLEVIVVVDGRDAATCDALRGVADARLVVHLPECHLGNANARNAGVALARAPWVAFLDDDDTWLPSKLDRQLAVARDAACPLPIVSCRLIARDEQGDRIWPRRLPGRGEDWSEYFFCRRTPFTGEGMVALCSLLVPRPLLLQLPFAGRLDRHVDPDWLLRAARVPGTCLEFVPEADPLVIWNMEDSRSRITTRRDWRASWEWCRSNRTLFSPRGYAAFVLHVVGSNAGAQHAWRAFPLLLHDAFTRGRPSALDVASYLANFFLPTTLQRRVAGWYGRRTSRLPKTGSAPPLPRVPA